MGHVNIQLYSLNFVISKKTPFAKNAMIFMH